jgi:hypothetical protein
MEVLHCPTCKQDYNIILMCDCPSSFHSKDHQKILDKLGVSRYSYLNTYMKSNIKNAVELGKLRNDNAELSKLVSKYIDMTIRQQKQIEDLEARKKPDIDMQETFREIYTQYMSDIDQSLDIKEKLDIANKESIMLMRERRNKWADTAKMIL